MTREEAIRIIDPKTTCDALSEIEYFGGFSGEWARSIALCEALSMAAAALREQETKCVEIDTVKPLTLDELRQMSGEPVWIKLFDPDEEFWALRNDWVDTRNPEPMILLHGRWYLHDDYGKTWLAYRQKPKEAGNDRS